MSKRKYMIYLWGVLILFIISTKPTQVVASNSSSAVEREIFSQEGLVQAIYENMVIRNENFFIQYKGSWEDVYNNNLNSLFDKVFSIDKKTSNDYDYLRFNVKKYLLRLSSNGVTSTFKFTITYRESLSQMKEVNTLVKKALKGMKIDKVDRYTKIKKIHNYIINKMSYDTTHHNYTAYSALTEKKAVCQGYSLLFYKMATEAGIPCRIVRSKSHAWNIVKIGDKWYHVDATWDDPISKKSILRYDYFLKGADAVSDTHILTAEYKTATFKKKFPISKTNFKR